MNTRERLDIYDLYDLLLEQLRDLYDGELQQLKVFREFDESANSFELEEMVASLERETKNQVSRLSKIFKMLEEEPDGEYCEGIRGLIAEAKKLTSRCKNPEVCDAGLITSIQHINHYEMAGYGTAIAYAKTIEKDDIAELLLESLREEKEADLNLSELAHDHINADAKWTTLIQKVNTGIEGLARIR